MMNVLLPSTYIVHGPLPARPGPHQAMHAHDSASHHAMTVVAAGEHEEREEKEREAVHARGDNASSHSTSASSTSTLGAAHALNSSGASSWSSSSKGPRLVFGGSSQGNAATDGVAVFLGLDEGDNMDAVEKYYNLYNKGNYFPLDVAVDCLRIPVVFEEDSKVVDVTFKSNPTAFEFIAVENSWGDLTLHDIEWNALHLAAFLNQYRLVCKILELDKYVMSVAVRRIDSAEKAVKKEEVLRKKRKVRDRHLLGITGVADAKGRLPLDIVYWKRETLIWHMRHEMKIKAHDSIRVVRERLSLTPKLIAKLTPVGEVTPRMVERNMDTPLEACWAQISSFIVFQALILIEAATNTQVWEVLVLCMCILAFVFTMGLWLYMNMRIYGTSAILPVYFFYSRLLLTVMLYFKTFWGFEQIDYSSVFLGVATLIEDLRTINEGVEPICLNYALRIIVPKQKDYDPIGSKIMENLESPLPSRGRRCFKFTVELILTTIKQIPLVLIRLTTGLTFFLAKLYKIVVLRGVLPTIVFHVSRDPEQQMRFNRYWAHQQREHLKQHDAAKPPAEPPKGVSKTAEEHSLHVIDLEKDEEDDPGEKPPFTDANCKVCNPCGHVWRATKDTVTRAWVRKTLEPYRLQNPNIMEATDRVDLFINTWSTVLTGDLFYVVSALALASCGVAASNCLPGFICWNCGPFLTADAG